MSGLGAPARLVVLALDVGGKWSEEAQIFIQLLAKTQAKSELWLMQRRVEQSWRLRWYGIIAWAAARSFVVLCGVCGAGTVPMGRRRRVIRTRPSGSSGAISFFGVSTDQISSFAAEQEVFEKITKSCTHIWHDRGSQRRRLCKKDTISFGVRS